MKLVMSFLWGQRAKWYYLLIASVILLFMLLDARELWTQEHRWADIVSGMFYRHDFFHPYIGETPYYDKPLLSYWFIALISAITGELTTWTLRLPSALAGLLAIWSIYRIGCHVKDQTLGLLSGWLLLTTFYFVFWARTSSADMLSLGGSLFAIAWYLDKKIQPRFIDFVVFFMILALTSLCKGLAVVPVIAVIVDVLLQKSWRRYLRPTILLALLPAIIVYLFPFWASSHVGDTTYVQNGLYLVYKENILRYFQAFDHRGPIYTYFIYLPIYLLPWTIIFIPSLLSLKSRWASMSLASRWLVYTLLCLFLFFSLSGSRRSYYVLPLIPFAIVMTAEWMLARGILTKRNLYTAAALPIVFLTLIIAIDIAPAWYYSRVGAEKFALMLREQAEQTRPWSDWKVVMLDGKEKLNFYLQLPPNTPHYYQQSVERLEKSWFLNNKPNNTIFISKERYKARLKEHFSDYQMISLPPTSFLFFKTNDLDDPIAFVPQSKS